jgi:hypothetical protein
MCKAMHDEDMARQQEIYRRWRDADRRARESQQLLDQDDARA